MAWRQCVRGFVRESVGAEALQRTFGEDGRGGGHLGGVVVRVDGVVSNGAHVQHRREDRVRATLLVTREAHVVEGNDKVAVQLWSPRVSGGV